MTFSPTWKRLRARLNRRVTDKRAKNLLCEVIARGDWDKWKPQYWDTTVDSKGMLILPCPFCGCSEPIIRGRIQRDDAFPAAVQVNVECDNLNCGALGPTMRTREDAIAFWNAAWPKRS